MRYAIKLTPDIDSGYVVTCRDIPELITQGDTIGECIVEASDALAECVAQYKARNKKLPTPSKQQEGEYYVYLHDKQDFDTWNYAYGGVKRSLWGKIKLVWNGIWFLPYLGFYLAIDYIKSKIKS
jgi:predicted RNase H-like HicB family nuclease